MDRDLTFKGIYHAYIDCRRRKRKTANAQRYEMGLLDHLVNTEHAIRQRRYHPTTSICFVAQQPKAREIYAANFSDRVVHHWLVPRLAVLYEPIFIHDVYSNREGKGTHKAVKRLQSFMRSLRNQCHEVYYLQLDIKNFFNSVNRDILYQLIKKRLAKSERNGKITTDQHQQLRWLTWRILTHQPTTDRTNKSPPAKWARVPAHKRLENAAPKCGLPIGNLTSQFFANVYLNELDQFIKHELKCRHYLRYVDDFVLLSYDKTELLTWRTQIIDFLDTHLQLQLKALSVPTSVYTGADFLGYIIRPDYKLVRHRVINHCRHKLHEFAVRDIEWGEETDCEIRTGNVRTSRDLSLPTSESNLERRDKSRLVRTRFVRADRVPSTEYSARGYMHIDNIESLEKLRSMLASYLGHFKHAHSQTTIARIWQEFPWLNILFSLDKQTYQLTPLYENTTLPYYRLQCDFFRTLFPNAVVHVQKGRATDIFPPKNQAITSVGRMARNIIHENALTPNAVSKLIIQEAGLSQHGIKRRVIHTLYF